MQTSRFLRSSRGLVTLIGVLALLASACSGDDDDSGAAISDAESGFGADVRTDSEDRDFGDTGADSAEEGTFGADAEGDFGEPFDGDAEGDFGAETAAADTAHAEGAAGEFGEPMAQDAEGGGNDFGEPEPHPTTGPDGNFEDYGIRSFVDADDDPLSTFALDVDTGAFSVARQWLRNGNLPPAESVRPEEYVNAFDYDYDDPDDALGLTIDGGPSPFDDDNVLVRVGVQGLRVDEDARPAASLTFVVDVSGSMDTDGRLELVKSALVELVDELDDDDQVSIVTFSDEAQLVLEPTSLDSRRTIVEAIESLRTDGSTNVEAGLRLGYEQANRAWERDGINRVILLSDGIANQGLIDPDGLADQLRDDADEGINLITVGVGLGGFNDVLMEQLADQGDGFYAYVDTQDEAERLFEDDLTGSLLTIAMDAKIQVEFDSDTVDEYRLIGFENRGVRDSDFRDDDVDAGEIGAGHQVTAIYELELDDDADTDIGEVSLRWEDPDSGDVTEIDADIEIGDLVSTWGDTDDDLRLAVVVASLAEILRDSPHRGDVDLADLAIEAERLADRLDDADVDELADMIDAARRLSR